MKVFNYFITLYFLIIGIVPAHSATITGLEVTYKCLDLNGNYQVTLRITRPCGSTTLCSQNCSLIGSCPWQIGVVSLESANKGFEYFRSNLYGVSVRDVNSTPQCSGTTTLCDNMGCRSPGTSLGYEITEFSGVINIGNSSSIPSNICKIGFVAGPILGWPSYDNANTLTFNINYAMVNRCLGGGNCNSSPIFSGDPVYGLCNSQPVMASMGGYDPDLDSMEYKSSTAHADLNNDIQLETPYSKDFPVPYTPPANGTYPNGFRVDNRTGDVFFKPNINNFNGLLSIQVNEYRTIGGQTMLVGTTFRDAIFEFTACNQNTPPTFQTNPTLNNNTPLKRYWDLFAEHQFCFEVTAKDSDFIFPSYTDLTELKIDSFFLRTGATFTNLGGREDTWRICWTPKTTQVKSQPYPLTLRARDSKCPKPGKASTTILLKVNAPIKITKNIQCGVVDLSVNLTNQPIVNKTWKISKTPNLFDPQNLLTASSSAINLKLNRSGKYPIQLEMQLLSGGVFILYDTIVIERGLKIRDLQPVCNSSQPVHLYSSEPTFGLTSFKWYKLSDTSQVLDTSEYFIYAPNQTTTLLLKAVDSISKCSLTDTSTLFKSGISPSFIVNQSSQCESDNNFELYATSKDTLGNRLYHNWLFSDTLMNFLGDTARFRFSKIGAYNFTLKSFTSFGCNQNITGKLLVLPSPNANFQLESDSAQCLNTNQYFVKSTSTPIDSILYTWQVADSILSLTSSAITFKSWKTGNLPVLMKIQHANGCTAVIQKNITTLESPIASFSTNKSEQCLIENRYLFTDKSILKNGTYQRKWDFGNNLSAESSNPEMTYTSVGSYQVKLNIKSNNGCTDSSELQVLIKANPNAAINLASLELCAYDSFIILNQSTSTGSGLSSQWITGDGNYKNTKNLSHSYTADGLYTITLVVEDNNCLDTAFAKATVHPKPELPQINGDTLVERHSIKAYSVQANGTSYFGWSVTGDSTHQVGSNYVLVSWGPNSTGKIKLAEVNQYGCKSDSAELTIRIIPKTSLTDLEMYNFSIIPQPAGDKLMLSGKIDQLKHAEILTLEGRLILGFNNEIIQHGELDTHQLSTGVYLLKLIGVNGEEWVKKISVVR